MDHRNTIIEKPYYGGLGENHGCKTFRRFACLDPGPREKKGETRSAVMRAVLQKYFSREKNRDTRSCLDLADDLTGSLDGPQDLSINPAHLDGYGK